MWWTNIYFEFVMVALCAIGITYNISVLITKKVYKTWSTSAILIFCSLNLLMRMVSFITFIIMGRDKPRKILFLAVFFDDIAIYLLLNITFVMIW